jgi:hypothetical protein
LTNPAKKHYQIGQGWEDIDNGRAALWGIIALICFAVMLSGVRPAMTALPAGTIEGVARDAEGQPLPGVRVTLRGDGPDCAAGDKPAGRPLPLR